MYCAKIENQHQETWEKLVAENPAGGFHQSFEWANFKELETWSIHKIGIFNQNHQLIGGAIVHKFYFPEKTNFINIPEAPILNWNNEEELFWQWRLLETTLHKITDTSKDQLTTHIRIEPRTPHIPEWLLSTFTKTHLNLQPRHTQQLDLAPSASEILAQMKPKCRYNIRLAQKNNIQIKKITDISKADLKLFYDLYSETTTRNKFEQKDFHFFQNFLAGCHPITTLYLAYHENNPLAAALVINHGSRVTYMYGASSNTNRNLMPTYLLHWQIIQDSKNSGHTQYDLWGTCAENDPTHEWAGLTKFKKQFGGNSLNFIGAYDQVLQKDAYQNFIKKYETD